MAIKWIFSTAFRERCINIGLVIFGLLVTGFLILSMIQPIAAIVIFEKIMWGVGGVLGVILIGRVLLLVQKSSDSVAHHD